MGADMITRTMKAMVFNDEQATAITNARRAMTIMTKEIREAKLSDRGDYPLLTVNPQNFVFFSNIDSDQDTEKVQYTLSGYNLLKIITEPGVAHTYTGPYSTTTIAQYVNNVAEPIFYYYDSNNATTTDIIQIRLVNLRLKINVTPARAPSDYYVETDINLRNLKSNL
jgi:hypothetical protein